MKFKLPNSGSKWFVPLHMCIMIVIALFIFYINTVEAGENGFADERVCLAKNIYFESANQPDAGRVAVAQVVLNRVEDLQFPNSICEVVYQAKMRTNCKGEEVPILNKCQFSWFCDGLFGIPKAIFPHLLVIRGSESPVSEQHTQFLEVLELLCRSTLRRV